MSRLWLGNALLVAVFVAADQVSKYWVSHNLIYREPWELLPVLSLYLTHNTGIAFSMFVEIGDGALLAMATTVLLLVLYLWWRQTPRRALSNLGFALIVAGALGNIIDRALLGYVVDFVLFHWRNWSFAVFNLADAFISIGVGAIVLDEVIIWRKSARNPS